MELRRSEDQWHSRFTAFLYVLFCSLQMVRFEWDATKSEVNREKHGIDFSVAKLVFDDPFCVTFIERITNGEPRWHAIGILEDVTLIVVAHTYRETDGDEVIRIISARRASKHERQFYEEQVNG
jgi:uncharacterized DUF497 family protein